QLGRVALGAGVLVIGVFAFAAFLIVGLGVLLGGRFWLSSLLVALILLAGGVGLMYLGARRLGSAFSPPRRTIDTLKDTGRWAGEEIGDLKAALAGDARPTERARPRRRSPGRVGTTSTSTEMIMDEA